MENSRVDTYTVSHWNEATCVRELCGDGFRQDGP